MDHIYAINSAHVYSKCSAHTVQLEVILSTVLHQVTDRADQVKQLLMGMKPKEALKASLQDPPLGNKDEKILVSESCVYCATSCYW